MKYFINQVTILRSNHVVFDYHPKEEFTGNLSDYRKAAIDKNYLDICLNFPKTEKIELRVQLSSTRII